MFGTRPLSDKNKQVFADMTDTVHPVFGYVFGVLLQNLVAIFFCNHHLHLFALFGQQQKKGVKALSNGILRVPEKLSGRGGVVYRNLEKEEAL